MSGNIGKLLKLTICIKNVVRKSQSPGQLLF